MKRGPYKNAVLHAAEARFPERMPMENRRRGTRIRDFRFEFAAEKMELWLGPGQRSVFKTRDEAQAAWIKHRDFLLLTVGSNGHRPAAWWIFELGLAPPDLEVETSTLWEMGALGEGEEAGIMKRWREEFERSFRYDGCRHAAGDAGQTSPRPSCAHGQENAATLQCGSSSWCQCKGAAPH